MKIIKTLEPIDTGASKSIFLAGPTYRINPETVTVTSEGNDVPRSWREDAIRYFDDVRYDGVVYYPEWPNNEKPDGWTYEAQVQWETDALNAADVIVFWIPRNMKDLPGLTTNIEFGEWMHSDRILVGAPDNADKMEYIKTRCYLEGIPFLNNLQGLSISATSIVEEKAVLRSNVWFTSDTHFGQVRTLNLSKRPFKNVDQMDKEMIRKWNHNVREGDVVYHLGDFGDASIAAETIKQLNGDQIFLLLGNYEDGDKSVVDQLLTDPRVTIISDHHQITIDGVEMRLIHEPENISGEDFYLFGHIHQLQMVKTKALNVGADCHNYAPIDKDTIMFYYNAIVNHYDANVFQDFRDKQEY